MVASVADRVARQFEEYILQTRNDGPKIGHPDALLGQAADDLHHQVLPAPIDR